MKVNAKVAANSGQNLALRERGGGGGGEGSGHLRISLLKLYYVKNGYTALFIKGRAPHDFDQGTALHQYPFKLFLFLNYVALFQDMLNGI